MKAELISLTTIKLVTENSLESAALAKMLAKIIEHPEIWISQNGSQRVAPLGAAAFECLTMNISTSAEENEK